MVWRCRNSAAANRRALHPDYTSATEKTPTPLNGRCTRPQNRILLRSDTRRAATSRKASTRSVSARDRANFIDTSKTLMKSMFSRISGIQFRFRARDENRISIERKQHRKPRALCRFYPGQNFFPQTHCLRRCATVLAIKNERIARQVIRVSAFAACVRASQQIGAKCFECARKTYRRNAR